MAPILKDSQIRHWYYEGFLFLLNSGPSNLSDPDSRPHSTPPPVLLQL